MEIEHYKSPIRIRIFRYFKFKEKTHPKGDLMVSFCADAELLRLPTGVNAFGVPGFVTEDFMCRGDFNDSPKLQSQN